MKKLTLRIGDKEHEKIALMAKKTGQSLNEFIINKAAENDEFKRVIDTIVANQSRAFDSLFVQLADLKNPEDINEKNDSEGLSASEFRDFNRQFLTLFSIYFGKQSLEDLQSKTNALQDKLTAKK
jgi:uncharacterized protein (DUF1778 family)